MGKVYGDSAFCGGGFGLEGVANFAALPPAADNAGVSYFVESAQGTPWLPGSLGGTYYPRGVYYSNGTEWLFQENPGQATQAEVDAGLIEDKFVSPKTLSGAGLGDKTFIFTQAVASTEWTVVHNLGKHPAIYIEDSLGRHIQGEISRQDDNTYKLFFNAAISGKTYNN